MPTNPDLRRIVASGTVTVVATALSYLAVAGSLFWVAPGWQVGLFCGAVAGLAAGSILQASITAPLTLAVLAAIHAPWYVSMWNRSVNLQEILVLTGVSVAAALGVSFLRFRTELPGKQVNTALAVALLAVVLANLWLTPMTVNYLSAAQNGSQLAADLQRVPAPLSYASDAEAYLRIHHLMQQGTGYYDAVRDAWAGKVGAESLPWGVVSYRLPTLFWLWNLLPAGGTALIPAFIVFCMIATVAAFMVPAQLGLMRLAPVAAALVAGNYLATAVTLFITYVDPWAMALTLAGFAALIGAQLKPSRALLWTSVALMVAAACMREILIYVPLVVVASALLLPKGERLKAMVPWVIGIGVFAAVYAAHVVAVDGKVAPTVESEVWSRGSAAALAAAVNLAQGLMLGKPWFMWFAIAMGIAGAAGLWRAFDRRLSVIALVVTTVPLASLLFVGNPGTTQGDLMVNYWGMLCIPFNLALAPAAILLLRPASAKSAIASPSTQKAGAKPRSKKR